MDFWELMTKRNRKFVGEKPQRREFPLITRLFGTRHNLPSPKPAASGNILSLFKRLQQAQAQSARPARSAEDERENNYIKKISRRGVYANVLNNASGQFGRSADYGVSVGDTRGAPWMGALAGVTSALGDALNAKSQRQTSKLFHEQKLREEENRARVAALEAALKRQEKIAERDEQRRYNEGLYQRHYGQSRADEENRFYRNQQFDDDTYQRRYEQSRKDEEARYNLRRWNDERDKILPRLSVEDRMKAYQTPGVERFYEPAHDSIVAAIPFGIGQSLSKSIKIPTKESNAFEKYRKNILSDNPTATDAEIFEAYSRL